MHAEHQQQVAFYLTGKRAGEGLEALDALALRPALFARYHDLSRLRFGFPLVLVHGGAGQPFALPLSAVVDRALERAAAPGTANERLRRHVLRLEREIRTLLAAGGEGSLSHLWREAATRLGAGTDEFLEDSVSRAGASLTVDGEVIDFGAGLPARLLTHAWRVVQEEKAARFRADVSRLLLKLRDILRADFLRSRAGRTADSLRSGVGTLHGGVFDFDAMSRLLAGAAPGTSLPGNRRQRIQRVLSVLESQRFYPGPEAGAGDAAGPYSFVFESCAAALEAYRERLPQMVELAKAIAVADLETEGRYEEPRHDAFFEEFGENTLDPEDLALFPDYLVYMRAGDMQAAQYAELMAMLSAGLPVKILIQSDDILQELPIGEERLSCGMRSARLASMATGLNDVYVLQASASHLVQFDERIRKGLAYPGAALFSVFSGASRHTGELPAYLVAAAAMESRAFPAFCYDPSAGPDWASRFSLEHNPQADREWPVHAFDYEDEEHQRVSEDLAFTFVDFVACDRRYAKHLARVPRAGWDGDMVPVSVGLTRKPQDVPDDIPYLLMIDREHRLHRVIAGDKLMLEARRCARMWSSLQELGGIHNSHAERLLAREKEAWEARSAGAVPQPEADPAAPAPASERASATRADPAAGEAEPEPASEEAYIETPRCTSCDECIHINGRLFAYDANKQAYVADIDAGTYRQLVEAAESCQVSIIHPGKPRNPDEPGLEELLERAEPFT